MVAWTFHFSSALQQINFAALRDCKIHIDSRFTNVGSHHDIQLTFFVENACSTFKRLFREVLRTISEVNCLDFNFSTCCRVFQPITFCLGRTYTVLLRVRVIHPSCRQSYRSHYKTSPTDMFLFQRKRKVQ